MTITASRPKTRSGGMPSVYRARSSAVVWVNGREAHIATMDADRGVSMTSVERGIRPEIDYLVDVVRRIGDRERVMILGPGTARLALEREYVAIGRRPDRLVDVEPAGPIGEADLIDRLRLLAS